MLKRGANQTINGTVKTTRALANGTTAVAGKVALTATLAYATLKNNIILFSSAFKIGRASCRERV